MSGERQRDSYLVMVMDCRSAAAKRETVGAAQPMIEFEPAICELEAITVVSMILLILELSQPFSGMFRIPLADLTQAIQALGS